MGRREIAVQDALAHHEAQLPDLDDKGWEVREWPHADARAGMRLHRLVRKIGTDEFMLHRFMPEEGQHEPHSHPLAVAAHVLGPGEYEVGFIVNGVCQARMVSSLEFYYEMITREVFHYVLPRTGPVYSVALWTDFPEAAKVPETRLRMPRAFLIEHVEAVFNRLVPISG